MFNCAMLLSVTQLLYRLLTVSPGALLCLEVECLCDATAAQWGHSLCARLVSADQVLHPAQQWDVRSSVELGAGKHSKMASEVRCRCSSDVGLWVHSVRFCGGHRVADRAASAFTEARFPDTFALLEAELADMRAWSRVRLEVRMPALFQTVVDQAAEDAYARVFSLLFRVSASRSLASFALTRCRCAWPRWPWRSCG